MNTKLRIVIFSLFLAFSSIAEAVLTLPSNLDNFTSEIGQQHLHKSANSNTLQLLSHFTTQKTVTYCGVASLVMILNSSGLQPLPDTEHPPFDYFNQADFFTPKVQSIVAQKDVEKIGITLDQLSEIAQSFGLRAKAYHADDFDKNHYSRYPSVMPRKFKETLVDAIENNNFVIVNFLRSALGQEGGGHHSPLAAYDKKSDRFLLLDVARYKYPAYWVTSEDLWKAVNTTDTDINKKRGILIMKAPKAN